MQIGILVFNFAYSEMLSSYSLCYSGEVGYTRLKTWSSPAEIVWEKDGLEMSGVTVLWNLSVHQYILESACISL